MQMSDSPLAARLSGPLPGLFVCGALACAAIELGNLPGLQTHGVGALTLAIALGIMLGNTARLAPCCAAGVDFCRQNLLRLGIILYGFRLTFQDMGQVGLAGVAIDVLILCSTFWLAILLGTKVFKLERDTAILIGAGSSICGAAAIMASAPVLRSDSEAVTVAVSTVVVFGTLSIFLYPLLYQGNLAWHFLATTPATFGMYIGSTVHEVAQVVAAARSIGPDAANTAVIAKMLRVMMLAPFLLILSAWRARSDAAAAHRMPLEPLAIPWFAFAFIAVLGFNSLAWLPRAIVAGIGDADTALLAMAMAALGLTTRWAAIRRAGSRPLMLAAVLFFWLIGAGAAINCGVALLLN
ncbi:putative integral membrane protein (TIGR00698 family) [Oxalobacteraceae bacterium GrIS 1.11]